MNRIALAVLLSLASPLALASVGIGIEGLVSLVIYLLVMGGIVWLLLWIIGVTGLQDPFAKVARIIIYVFAALVVINLLLGLIGQPIFVMH